MSTAQAIRERIADHIAEAEVLIASAKGTVAPDVLAGLHLRAAQALSVLAALDSQDAAAKAVVRDFKGSVAGFSDMLGRIAPPPEESFPTV